MPAEQQAYDTTLLPLLLLVRLAVFFPLRVYQGLWRCASIWDLRNIVVGVTLSSVVHLGHHARRARHHAVSTTPVGIIDALLLICLMGGVRLGRRLYAASSRRGDARRVLIYGAGDAGQNYVIRTSHRDALRDHLRESGVETLVRWAKPVWEHRALSLGEPDLPNTRRICREVLSLPMSAETFDAHVDSVIDAMRRFFGTR